MTKPRILVVEDDEAIRLQLKYALREHFELALAEDRPGALRVVAEQRPPVVTLDLGLPPSPDTADEGLKTLAAILETAPETKVVVMTGNADRSNALRAVSLGAFDYHLKPVDLDAVKVVLQRAAQLHQLEREAEKESLAVESALQFQEILGSTPRMKEIFSAVSRVARTDATVLIQGESGTGKELIARAVHARSGRRGSPFIPINCGAIPETLLESELFGHEKGAYTGAHVQRKGKIEVAEGGTLLLDEIAEMSLLLQVKLLRFLQEREIERIGGREPIKVDVRIIAATNKELPVEIKAGRFREDLYYRLSVVTIKVPPLRERGEDLVLLANAFLRRSAQQHRRKVRLSAAALEAIAHYAWPGNIRELENTLQRAVIMTSGRVIEPGDLGIQLQDEPAVPTLREARSQREREILVDALIRTKGNISHAAANLGISRPTFHGLLDKHQINARDFKA